MASGRTSKAPAVDEEGRQKAPGDGGEETYD